MIENKEFENSFKLSRISLILSGIPLNKLHFIKPVNVFITHFLYYFNCLWLYTEVHGGLTWIIEGIKMGKSFVELSLTAPCATISFLSTAKTIILFFNTQTLKSIIDELRAMHIDVINEGNEQGLDSERNIINGSVKFIYVCVISLGLYCIVVALSFDIIPVSLMIYEYYTTGSTGFKLPFLVKYVIDPNTITLWTLAYLHQIWSTIIVLASMFGADTLFFIFCIYIRMHFQILSRRFENVSCGHDGKCYKLEKLIVKHQKLIQLVDRMEFLFSKSILFHMLTSSVLICLSLFNITFLEDIGSVFTFLMFLGMSLTQIALVCYFGDMLITSSTQLSQSVYNCKWYNENKAFQKMILFVVQKAQRPCKITASGFADLNLITFTSILSTSWTYFALLKTMYD